MYNFPASPTENQEFTPSGGPTYVWKAPRWMVKTGSGGGGGVATTIADTPPAGTAAGQLWWESDTGNLFVWYDDGDSQQWVQTSGTPGGYQTALPRNRIVNGAMRISQENGGTPSAAVGSIGAYYPADQWWALWNLGAGSMTSQSTIHDGSRSAVGLSNKTVHATMAAAEHALIRQPIEGINVSDLLWGTASAKNVVLRFDVISGVAGTYSARIANFDSTRSYVAQFAIPANSWRTITLSIPGDTTGTWTMGNTTGLQVAFAFAAGSNYTGVLGWQVGNIYAAAGNINGCATVADFHISNVGLYLDPNNTGVAPPWQMPDEAEELRACQRYYERNWGVNIISANAYTSYPFKVAKRSIPAVTFSNVNAGSITNMSAGSDGFQCINITAQSNFFFHANARM